MRCNGKRTVTNNRKVEIRHAHIIMEKNADVDMRLTLLLRLVKIALNFLHCAFDLGKGITVGFLW